MLRAPACVLSIPLFFALVACGGAPPPASGANATSGKPSDAATSSGREATEKEATGKDKTDVTADNDVGEGAADTGDPDKHIGASRGLDKGGPGAGKNDGTAAPPPPPPQQAAVVSTTPLSGRLTQQEIGDILSKNAAYFNDCYTIGAGKGREFTGTVTVKATVGPSGAVTVAEVIKSTAKNAKVDACVVTAFKKIKFPPPKDGGTSVITFPMEFQGVEQVK